MTEHNGMKLVRVEWVDSASNSYWLNAKADEETFTPVHIVSFGILFKDEPDYIVIMQSFNDDVEQVGSFTSIPRQCVTKLEEL